ncbi:MAG: DegT/DnrJ/EryC1/StrS family aminotransferase [Armatimonadota bacterium]
MSPQIPMYDKSATNPADLLVGAMSDVAAVSWYEAGTFVREFERAFAQLLGVEHCVSCASGTDALILALKALHCAQSDEIALVANAGFYGSSAVHTVGAVPVYVDVDDASLCMCPAALEDVLKHHSIKAVIVTHLYGQLADITAIQSLCRIYGVALVEDCAQACGASDANGSMAGSFGDIACFSFYPTKNLGAYGDGGALCCNSPELAANVMAIKQYGWRSKYIVDVPRGMNSRLDPVQAAILTRKLPVLAGWNNRRREIAQLYTKGLAGILRCPRISSNAMDYVAHLYVARTPLRDELRAHLSENEIMSDIHYPVPDYRQSAYNLPDVRLPVTEANTSQLVSLPCYPGLSDESVYTVINAIKTWKGRGC